MSPKRAKVVYLLLLFNKMDNLNKKKILIVDDDESLNNVLVDKLNLSGYEAIGASDGVDGLKKALEMHPDLILLDLLMPKMDGLQMLKELREDSWGKLVKVIILTLLEQADYVAKTMDKNVYGYLVKTNFSLEDVVKKVEDALK